MHTADSTRDAGSRHDIAVQVATNVVGAAAVAPDDARDAAQNAQPDAQNPVTQYPEPPFPLQQQEWPGLAARMTPRPDHGESSYRGSGRLTGRRALITGGDSGIGRAAAIAFAREGADVAINYLADEEADAQEVVQLIEAEGRNAAAIPGDIRTEDFCTRLVEEAVRALGGLDILVNNAGRQQSNATLEEITSEQFDWTFRTNVYAPFWITKAALKHLGAGACIINTASEQAYDPSEDLVDYAQTKACNVSFTKSLAKQLAKKGIRVNAVAPGPYWTALQVTGGREPEELPQFGAKTPMGRAGQPAEIAPLYVMLASAEASYSTGQVVGSTGGTGVP
ncbi:MAG TPA: SDR family oxidoreductase [Gemmatimonadaceae bacterium]|nr:SDR family oxidoreductase [Gemmatimonadaceae bacterium]